MKRIYRLVKDKKLLSIIKKRKIKILWYPSIHSKSELEREISRIVWYMYPIRDYIDSITISTVKNRKFIFDEIEFPDYIDQNISNMYEKLKHLIVYENDEKIDKLVFDVVVTWKAYRKNKRFSAYMINADIFDNQFEANQIVQFSSLFLSTDKKQKNKQKLLQKLQKLLNEKVSEVILFGSGPSLEKFENDNVNKISIICNSVVKNLPLLRKINPQIIVATDSVFHAGYSKYAQVFRSALCKVLDEFPLSLFIVPLRHLLLYKENLPLKYQNRVFGLEGKRLKKYNLNILKKPSVKSTSNVLTFFMIPIAASLSKNIKLIGFDGKASNDNDKFWSYAQGSQFETLLDTTKIAHPSFYSVDYDEYNEKHILETRTLINLLKVNNYNIRSLAHSNIEILDNLYD